MRENRMADRIAVSVSENLAFPSWFENVAPFTQKALDTLGFSGEEISILLCDDVYMSFLNKTYRGIEGATDVLSFENGTSYIDEEGRERKCAGDIAISLDTLSKNAAAFETDVDSEFKRLIVHGLLHLNGYDHGEEHIEAGKVPQCDMLVIQEQTLAKLCGEKIIGDS